MKKRSRNLALVFLLVLLCVCFILPFLVHFDPLSMDPKNRLCSPSLEHLLGTDEFGRDLFARILYGGQISLSIAIIVSGISLILGLLIGIYCAVSPTLDRILMRITDALMSIPAVLLALALMSIFKASVSNVILALCVVYTPLLARVARGSALKIKNEYYIEALTVAGLNKRRILFWHILPNMLSPIFVQISFIFADTIISEAALSFLGAGIPAKEASWGNIISSGKLLIGKAPHMIIIPALLIFFLLLAINHIADSLDIQYRELSPTEYRSERERQEQEARNKIKTSENLLELKGLCVQFPFEEGSFTALEPLDLTLKEGEVIAVVGESGSGKSSLCNAILRLFEPNTAKLQGSVFYNQTNLLALSEADFNMYRGNEIAMVFQDPAAALDPVFTIGHEMAELFSRKEQKQSDFIKRMENQLREVGISDPERILSAYPHELSGGLKQRVLIAFALAKKPKILLADEPTTALDVSTQKGIMDLFVSLKEKGLSILFITHDLSLLENFADHIYVLKGGQLIEQSESRNFFTAPQHFYSQQLLNAIPSLKLSEPSFDADKLKDSLPPSEPILTVREVSKTFVKGRILGREKHLKALDQVSFSVPEHSCTALVGESASGKTTCGRIIVGLERMDEGKILYKGTALQDSCPERRREVQMIFQNPLGSFDPRQTINQAFSEIERLAGSKPDKARRLEMLERIELDADSLNKRPHEFSGGQAQRLAIARALLLKPRLLILAEALTGLDVLVQEKMMVLLRRIQIEEKLSYLFITHDLRAVRHLADQIVVMKRGQIREISETHCFFTNPQDEYSQSLIEAVPKLSSD